MNLALTEPFKNIARRVLPDIFYQRLVAFWQQWTWFAWALKIFLKYGRPEILIHFRGGPGDDLLCTAVLHELRKRGRRKIWMMPRYPELFEGNGTVARVVPMDRHFQRYVSAWRGEWQLLEYAPFDLKTDMSLPPKRHIIAELCARAGVEGNVTLRPYFHLKEAERSKAAWADGMVAIQSSGMANQMPMRNKQWFPERFQEVINGLKADLKFVQLGSASDPLLDGVVDLRGKNSIRETAAILANCRLNIGNVGLLMHLARAVECPSVIVYGGREAPWQSGYNCNLNLYSAEPCAPCWLWNRCDYNRVCMEKITADDVIRAVQEMVKRPRHPLPEDSFKI